MSEKDKIDQGFRAQADRLEPISLSWTEINEQIRKRRRFRMLAVAAVALIFAIVLTILLLAVRTALDPTFEPPLVSAASASGKIVEPEMGRGVVTEGEFLGRAGGTAAASIASEEQEGYPLAATVRLSDLQGTTLIPKWRLRAVGESRHAETNAAAIGKAVVVDEVLAPDSRTETRRLRAWVSTPASSGRYVAELVLVAKGQGAIERFKSRPFQVVRDDCCARYLTPSYTAVLPHGWWIDADYEPAPGGRFVSEAVGPGGTTVIIDTTPHARGAAMASEHYLEGLFLANTKDYRRIALMRGSYRGREIVEWSYQVEGKTDTEELFYRDGGGFAIRGVSERARFRETRELCRLIEKTLRTRQEEGQSG